MPTTFFEGLLSGLAHPVIGPDHLAMVLLVGAYCGVAGKSFLPAASFVGASLIGCLLHVAKLDLPYAETGLATSLVIAGLVAIAVAPRPHLVATIVLGLTGVLHGYAFGESIVGAEPSPLVAYVIGFSLVQLALAAGVWMLAKGPAKERRVFMVRGLGALSVLIGALAVT